MILDERKRRILQAIIDDYIDTAEPIGSRTIARKHMFGLSSATIRNEMADLEEMGYLAQPHTSAGRVPSDKGYRIYVDELMDIRKLTAMEIDSIKRMMNTKIRELGQLLHHASSAVSYVTRYTSVAVAPKMMEYSLKAVQVVPVDTGKALVITVASTGTVNNCLVKISERISADILIQVSNIINEKLSGLSLEKINAEKIKELEKLLGSYADVLVPVLEGVGDCIRQACNAEFYIDGSTNLLNFPEFKDIVKAKELLDLIDEKITISRMLSDFVDNGIRIIIGSENEVRGIRDCSLITATYCVRKVTLGSIGVIGPTRMDYAKVVSSLSFIRNWLDNEISMLWGGLVDDSGERNISGGNRKI